MELPCLKPSGKGRSVSINKIQKHIRRLKKGLDIVGQIIYPPKCLKCGAYIESGSNPGEKLTACFCENCLGKGTHPILEPYCTRCGISFHNSFNENHCCGTCIKTPLKINRVRGCLDYKGIIKDAIPLFKYHAKLSVGQVFENMLFESFLAHFAESKIDLIMPIPLHKRKLRQRQFNQAYLLVRHFPKLFKNKFKKAPTWHIEISSLLRIKGTKPQTGFDIKERKKNLKNAFQVVNKKSIKNKNILLIDDVLTTGATCNEAAKVLMKNGAREINALVLARA